MQSQPDSQSNTVSTAADTEAQLAECEPSAQEDENTPAAPAETEAVADERETGVQAEEAPASMAVTEVEETTATEPTAQSQTESSENTVMMEVDTAAKPDAPTKLVPDTNTKSCSDGQKVKKQGKADGRKYVPSKKAMVDPLKIDMSKPRIIPLTSSQLSLQCMECHIIFRDHKSKERHLKLNHPAEYEQCILRNALFACYVCDQHFTNSIELMTHQKAHKEKKPFKCPICDLAFNKSSELTSHKKIHFGQDGYPCTDCGKTCKTLTLLKYHLRTHTGERPYVCKDCGKRFTMSKTLQKHMMGHLSEGAEGDLGDTTVKARPKKNDSASTTKYPCSLCKAIFKSSRTRLRHIKSKHNVLPAAASNALSARQQEKQCTPIITPISICQPGLLQVEPDGPLQKVDANIDTEQICRLIESMGNVQKVNQVVILGQVPPDAPPLEVQQISQLVEPVNSNVSVPQIDFIGLKQAETKTVELLPSNIPCDAMEHTIILEPITPDGQLENPSFSELGSHLATDESIELTLVPAEHTLGEMQQILQQPEINVVHSDPMDQMVCQNEVDEQTVILELTPALIPTAELEQSETVPQNEIPSSTLVNAELETPGRIADQTLADEQETSMSVPPFEVELELTPLQPEQQDICSCSLVPPDPLTQTAGESETNPAQDAPMQTGRIDQGPSVMEGEIQETAEQEPTDKPHVDSKNKLTEAEAQAAKEEVPSQTDQVPQISEIPVNVMSAQELVKVRKRKPARAFFFQGYMQDLVGSIYRDDFQYDAKPAKRQRKNKSHLVVKFGPQSKEKKNKQKKSPQQHQSMQEEVIRVETDVAKKKVPSQKKGRKGKKAKTVGNALSAPEKQSSSAQVSQVQQVTVDKSKNKGKRQKEGAKGGVTCIGEHKTVAAPMFKKKKQAKMLQKDQPKNVKAGQAKKSPEKDEQVNKEDIPASRVTQDSLLLLKGHKQPQLKVYKLDPSKALDASPNESQTASDISNKQSEVTDSPKADGKKKGGRPKKNQKVLSLLSSIQVSHQPQETPPTKPKTTRKRKASSKVETEGVITSKRALKCKDCGENFSEVSSLQKHKATVHIVESPSLTYTNGNIFEGVSRLDLYQFPKEHDKAVEEVNAAAGWDTEPEMALEDKERNLSFPALIPSPSLPNPALDVDITACEEKGVSKRGSDNELHTSPEIHSPSDEIQNGKTLPNFTSESFLSTSTQTRGFEAREALVSDEHKQGEDTPPSSESEVKCDEDIKEDLLLEVDLVTVGEQNERDGPVSHEETVTQTESNESADRRHEQPDDEPSEKGLTSQTVSCSTHEVEIKEEEEEMLVQKKKDGGKATAKRKAARSKRRAAGHQKRDARLRRGSVGGREPEKEQDECQVVYEKHLVTSDSEVVDHESGTKTLQSETSPNKPTAPVTTPKPPTSEESSEGQVVLELAAVTTRVEEVTNETGQQGGEEEDRNQSPGIILEKVLSSRQRGAADKEPCQMTARDNQRQGLHSIAQNEVQVLNSQEIKDEENSSDPQQVAPACEKLQRSGIQPHNHRDIRTVLVKEESSDAQAAHGSKHIRWNVESVSSDNAVITLMESEDTTTECCVTPEFNTTQCIFYPVKEEEREVLLGAAQTTKGSLVTEGSSDKNLTEFQSRECNIYEESPSPSEYHQTRVRGLLSEPGLSNIPDGQDSQWPYPSDLREFLLQSSDEEDAGGFELSDPQLDSEAEVMAYFYGNRTNTAQQPNLPTVPRNPHASTEENRTRKPIDYFSKYFGWDTWVDIASCTNKLSNPQNLVTAREVACFVGIHIAMGTLKFPSPKLYWEDLTKVSLIADAMPLCRFLELSRMLKLTSPTKDPASSQRERTCDSPTRRQPHNRNDFDSSQTDPLWKVQPILCRFRTGCQSLRRQGDYAVDQYPLPLTGKKHSSQPSLHCTTLIGFGGLVLHVDLKLDLSDKEGAVEKMVPKGSMVFLCKQELSTPAMLECLLGAGVHGAGRVGGARGQIGDEFVSSDGKLMLRRSHCGFILSTAGNCQSNMTSLIDNFEKAQMSARLNRDLQNLYSIPLTASVPSCWPQAVLWYLTDLALVNSWLLYRQCHAAPLTLMAFRLEVSKALILSSSSDTQDSVPPQPPTEKTHTTNGTPNPALVEESPLPDAATRYDGSGHWPEQLGEGEGGRCRFGDCQRTSRVLCLKCCVFLCISRNHNCFLNFHNQGSLEKE